MQVLIAWIVAFMTIKAPIDQKTWFPAAQETVQEREARYATIAHDLAVVAFDSNEEPIFEGPDARSKTAALMMGIAFEESGFRKDIDFGVGSAGRGDHGRSVCLMQINVGPNRTRTYNKVKKRFALPSDPKDELEIGYTADEMLRDRTKCFRAGLRIARHSWETCKKLPEDQRLTVYVSGKCGYGVVESHARVTTGLNWYKNHNPTFSDAAAMSLVANDQKLAELLAAPTSDILVRTGTN